MKAFKYLSIFFFCISCFAADLRTIYTKGNGQIYNLKSKGFPDSVVTIYNAAVEKEDLWVEFYIESGNGILKTGIWQQFQFNAKENSSLVLKAGYILSQEMTNPQKLNEKHLHGSSSLNMSQFLIKNKNEIKKYFIKDEEISVPAGTVLSSLYQVEGSGQKVRFWIAKESSPLVMIKLVSTAEKKANNYKMELLSLAKNVKIKIDPKKAVSLSPKMKDILNNTPLK